MRNRPSMQPGRLLQGLWPALLAVPVSLAAVAPAAAAAPVPAVASTAAADVAEGIAKLRSRWHRDGSLPARANANAGKPATADPPAAPSAGTAGAPAPVPVPAPATSTPAADAAAASRTAYLRRLLDATPSGGWVKASVEPFRSAWPTGADLPPPTPSGPVAVLYAWSGFAWDSRRSNLLLFGGGHGDYVGNEVYVWRGSDGRWTRGSLPTRVDLSTSFVIGGGAPQSSHTYATSAYAAGIDRFVVFGGAAWNSGAAPADGNGRTGPWWWDPSRADPERVASQEGTGWNPARRGTSAWQVRPHDPWVGLPPGVGPSFVNGASAAHVEGGRDVIYLTMDQNASYWPHLYRYVPGTPTTPDVWQRVGVPSGQVPMGSGGAAIDSRHGLFVRTASGGAALAVWTLSRSNATHPELNPDRRVALVEADGTPVTMNASSAIGYDAEGAQFVVWDGRARGTVWSVRPAFDADGSLSPVWVARRAPSTTAEQPRGNHGDGVLGKWRYAPELAAFVALDAGTDGDIWLYKPVR